jgi:hypothetical protein
MADAQGTVNVMDILSEEDIASIKVCVEHYKEYMSKKVDDDTIILPSTRTLVLQGHLTRSVVSYECDEFLLDGTQLKHHIHEHLDGDNYRVGDKISRTYYTYDYGNVRITIERLD